MDTRSLPVGRLVVIPKTALADLVELTERSLEHLPPELRSALRGSLANVLAESVPEP